MTRSELREAVARALVHLMPGVAPFEEQYPSVQKKARGEAEKILAVVREALREPSEAMINGALDRPQHKPGDMYGGIWRAMLAASPLGDE